MKNPLHLYARSGFRICICFRSLRAKGPERRKWDPEFQGIWWKKRLTRLHALAEEMAERYRKTLIGSMQTVIPEKCGDDWGTGWSGSHVRTRVQWRGLRPGELVRTRITGMDESGLLLGE